MRVAMILGAGLGMLPWSYFYLDELLKQNCEVTVISWNREGIGNEGVDARITIKEYKENIDNSIPKFQKIQPFLRFRKYTLGVLKGEQFDLIIVPTLQIALLFYDQLIGKYKNKYIYDIRDPWIENKLIIKVFSDNIVRNAELVFVSSEAFKKWLPVDAKIVTTHNVRFQDKEKYESLTREKGSSVIRIVFWGITREVETNIRFIKIIANDKRFQLEYYGVLMEESKAIFKYCDEHNIKNVHYMGAFPKDGRVEIASKADLIHDIYMSESETYDTRMFNKYYDGVVFEIPQIAYNGGFAGECVEKYGVGVTVGLCEGDGDKIYKYIHDLDHVKFQENCRAEQSRIKSEMLEANKRLTEVIHKLSKGILDYTMTGM